MKRKPPLMPKKLRTDQKGFTLIEILIAVAIVGLIAAAAGGSIVQVIQSTDTTAHMLAVRQVQTAGYWVSTDGLQAQYVTATGPTGFPLKLRWTDSKSHYHNIAYTLEPMDGLYKLLRSEGATSITVGRYLTDDTICSWSGNARILTLTVEASVTGAHGPETETRTYEIEPRPLS
jgi:prepilin-type N-terminal cleavage/methylation domain-containing protein